ncbi:MAG: PadR family transcriptional regulator [Bacillota bacterium]
MLSNVEVVLLSIVNEKPSYAYEIDKTIDSRDMRRWVRIGVASIYQVLKRLEEKKLVYSEKEKEGRMPDRNRYYITDSGRAALVEASQRLLSNLEWYYLDLNLGLEISDLLSPGEIAGCLTKRLYAVQANIKRLNEIYSADNDMAFKKKAVIKSLIYFREAEEKLLEELIKERGHTDRGTGTHLLKFESSS